jgi:dienelactone hydrolase
MFVGDSGLGGGILLAPQSRKRARGTGRFCGADSVAKRLGLFSILSLICGFFSGCLASPPLAPIFADSNMMHTRLLLPPGGGRRPAVILLHGSEGGSDHFLDGEAASLAASGFVVAQLCYFDCDRPIEKPRAALRSFDVEEIAKAAMAIKAHPACNGKIALYGFSRGAELALLAASQGGGSDYDAIAVHAPSDHLMGPVNWAWRSEMCWVGEVGRSKWNVKCGNDSPASLDFRLSPWRVRGQAIKAGTRIEVEKIRAPLFITQGMADKVQAPAQAGRISSERTRAGLETKVMEFQGDGHVFHHILSENRRRKAVLEFLWEKIGP